MRVVAQASGRRLMFRAVTAQSWAEPGKGFSHWLADNTPRSSARKAAGRHATDDRVPPADPADRKAANAACPPLAAKRQPAAEGRVPSSAPHRQRPLRAP